MKKAKKVIISLLCLSMVIQFSGCGIDVLGIEGHDETAGNATVDVSAATESEYLIDLVTDAYSKECEYAEEVFNNQTGQREKTGKTIIHTYRIPQINISSGDAERINAELYEALYPSIEEAASEIAEYHFLFASSAGISYRWAVNGDILSLVVFNDILPDSGGISEYMVYNISVSDGTVVSDDAVIVSAGLSEDEFYARARQALEADFRECWYIDGNDLDFTDFFYGELEKTISEENIRQSRPYINEKGQLCVIARQHTMVVDYFWTDLNLTEFSPLEDAPSTAPSEMETVPHAEGSLRYPISEEDGYIIFRNYFGFDMWLTENSAVEVSRSGEGDDEMLLFTILFEVIEGKPYDLWGFFEVYVNTGVCTGGAAGHSDLWSVFQADDYYY